MKRLLAYQFELDPTDRQRTAFRRACDLARHAYNWGLAIREAHYELVVEPEKAAGKKVRSLTAMDQMYWWRKIQDEEFPWAREFSSRIPRHAFIDLDRAYQNWWSGTAKHPKFKSRTTAKSAFRTSESVSIDGDTIALPRMGHIRIKGHADGRVRGVIKQATVSEQAGRWFVSLLVAEEVADVVLRQPASEDEIVGIDVGLRNSLTLSTGEVIQGPRALATHERRLARYQRVMSRRQKGSGRRKRAVVQVAREHARIASVRRNWQHEVSDDLTERFAVIGHETLNVKGLSNHKNHNGRAWADLGIAEVFRQIGYKAAWRGVTIVKADRFYPSSKTCSNCGAISHNLKRSDTVFVCSVCGFRLDRDLNAAQNLRPVAAIPVETLNARGGNVRPRSSATTALWQIPMKREPASDLAVA